MQSGPEYEDIASKVPKNWQNHIGTKTARLVVSKGKYDTWSKPNDSRGSIPALSLLTSIHSCDAMYSTNIVIVRDTETIEMNLLILAVSFISRVSSLVLAFDQSTAIATKIEPITSMK